jgi:hypothetical protein
MNPDPIPTCHDTPEGVERVARATAARIGARYAEPQKHETEEANRG